MTDTASLLGKIFFASWGWEETHHHFYMVVKVTPKRITLAPMEYEVVSTNSEAMTRQVKPTVVKAEEATFSRAVIDVCGQPMVKINRNEIARPFKKEVAEETCYA